MDCNQNFAPTVTRIEGSEPRPFRPLRNILIGTALISLFGISICLIFPKANAKLVGEISACITLFLVVLPVVTYWLWNAHKVLAICCAIPMVLAAPCALQFSFPSMPPEKLGQISFYVVSFLVGLPILAAWLWRSDRKFWGSCCFLLASLSVVTSLGVVHVVQDQKKAFMDDVAKSFVAEGSGDNAVLRHSGLGIAVKSPGEHYVTKSGQKGSCVYWGFTNVSQGKGLVVFAATQPITTSAEMQKEVRDFVNGASRDLCQGAVKIEHTNVVWQPQDRHADVVGTVAQGHFFMRLIVANKRPDTYPLCFGAFGFSLDRNDACNLAQSIREARKGQ